MNLRSVMTLIQVHGACVAPLKTVARHVPGAQQRGPQPQIALLPPQRDGQQLVEKVAALVDAFLHQEVRHGGVDLDWYAEQWLNELWDAEFLGADPRVIVPVLSRTTVVICPARSRLSLFLIRIPNSAPLPVPPIMWFVSQAPEPT